jgi:hypothetical protein
MLLGPRFKRIYFNALSLKSKVLASSGNPDRVQSCLLLTVQPASQFRVPRPVDGFESPICKKGRKEENVFSLAKVSKFIFALVRRDGYVCSYHRKRQIRKE